MAVLGGDDHGRVTWAPRVHKSAKDHGLQLLESGALIDAAARQTPSAGVGPMPVTSRATSERSRVMRPEDEAEVLARAPAAPSPGETLVVGGGGTLPRRGFDAVAPGARRRPYRRVPRRQGTP